MECKILKVNLEEGYPPVNEAIMNLKNKIIFAKKARYKYLYIIHGYGSSGFGGKIRDNTRRFLRNILQKHEIQYYILGEEFNCFNENARKMLLQNKEFSNYAQKYNPGVTFVGL